MEVTYSVKRSGHLEDVWKTQAMCLRCPLVTWPPMMRFKTRPWSRWRMCTFCVRWVLYDRHVKLKVFVYVTLHYVVMYIWQSRLLLHYSYKDKNSPFYELQLNQQASLDLLFFFSFQYVPLEHSAWTKLTFRLEICSICTERNVTHREHRPFWGTFK